MATYLLHYCYDQQPFSGDFADLDKPKASVQRQGRWLIELANDLEYISDVSWIESFLNNEHIKVGDITSSNFQLLGWQCLSGHSRPAEAG